VERNGVEDLAAQSVAVELLVLAEGAHDGLEQTFGVLLLRAF
jgi:hypothetical protein